MSFTLFNPSTVNAWSLAALAVVLVSIIAFIYMAIKRRSIKSRLAKEDASGLSGVEFKTLDAFIQHLPEYCIKDDTISQLYRKALESVGAEFQQRVFVDTTGGQDKTLWMRKKSNMFIHDKGFYFDPIHYSKKIIYHFKGDSRPIIDMANDADWKNPEMCSRNLFSAVNTADMNARRGIDEKTMMYIVGAIIVGILISIVVSYSGMKQEQEHYEALYRFINQTRHIP